MRKSGLAVKINCSRVNSRGCPRSRSRPWLDSSAVSPRVNAWLPSLTVMLAANVAAALLLAPPCLPQGRRLAAPLMDTPSMKAQMVAYLEMVKAQGRELTPEQQQMVDEIQGDEALLSQTGLVDFSGGEAAGAAAAAPAAAAPAAAPVAAAPVASASVTTAASSPAGNTPRAIATRLLTKRTTEGALAFDEQAELRSALGSLIFALSAVD